MEKALIMFGGFLVGTFFGYSILAEMNLRQTVVEIRTEPRVMWSNFKSNNNNKGDTYLILMDGDTLAIGEFDGYQWK
jgi:hypothetical protein